MAKSSSQLRIIQETPAYWRAVFDNPPLSIMGARMFEGLQDLLARMDASPSLRVVVFESSNPEFYLAHFDLSDIAASLGLMKIAGPVRSPHPDRYVRPPHQVPGRQHCEDSGTRPRSGQRIRTRLRH